MPPARRTTRRGRIKRRHRKYREEGRFTGGRPGFGFERVDKAWRPGEGQVEVDRPRVGAEQVAAERRALREAVSGLLAGLTNQSQIARTWNAAGLWTTEGQPWVNNAVRDTLLRPTIAGRIEYQGELISHLPGEPIIEERAWLRLKAKIDGRRRGRPLSDRYLATGLIRCGRCGKTLNGQVARQHPGDEQPRYRYGCNGQRGGCGLTIDMVRADAELRALTIARLSDPRYARAIATARAQVSTRLAELTAEIDQIEAVRSALAERVGRREMSVAEFDKSAGFLRADLEPLIAERDALGRGAIEGPTQVLTGVDVARQWDEADSTIERRAMLADAIGTDHVRILPSPPGPGQRRFNPDRIVLVPADTPLRLTPHVAEHLAGDDPVSAVG
jgi:site-specific DNA recombinase